MNKYVNLILVGVFAAAIFGSATSFAQDEVRFGPETYSAPGFDVDSFIGTMEIIVEPRNDIEISAVGDSEHMEHLQVSITDDGNVEVSYDDPDARRNAWSNWSSWFRSDAKRLEEFPTVTVRLPAGTPVHIDGITGWLTAGDLNGEFLLVASGSLRAVIGDVASAHITSSGSGNIELGDIVGDLHLLVSGSGDFEAGTSHSAVVRTSGSSSIGLGAIATGLEYSASGSGDLEAVSINGPLEITLNGSGRVRIEDGHATRFAVRLSGSGSVRFDGTAEDTTITTRGSGSVRLAAVDGSVEIRGSGSGNVRIGEGRADGFDVRLAGSGDVDFGGTAIGVKISTTGSGQVTIQNRESHTN